jgi:hypothetical protein
MLSAAYLFLLAMFSLLAVSLQATSELPVVTVDLGYETHEGHPSEGVSYSAVELLLLTPRQSGVSYHFRNIRYAMPPVDDLRFKAPVPATGSSNHTESGLTQRICPQAEYAWKRVQQDLFEFVHLDGYHEREFNWDQAENWYSNQAPYHQYSPHESETEDCLFLDIHVPCVVFQPSDERCSRNQYNRPELERAAVPVLIW